MTLGSIHAKWKSCENVNLFFFDFSKAFDSVNHSILLKKLARLNFNRKFYLLLSSFLSNRSQSVSINGSTSSKLAVTSGVPQGSILGVIFFLIYIDDLPYEIQFMLALLFADDLTSSACLPTKDIHLLKEDLRRMQNWSEANQIYSNAQKCSFIQIKGHMPFTPQINQSDILQMDHAVDLGLTIIGDLKRTTHINARLAKANKAFHLIRRISSHSISIYSKVNLDKSIVVPSLLYASECY